MFVVHATARLLAKLGPPAAGEAPASTTSLGAWYATVLRWRSPVALFVNEATLLPVLLPEGLDRLSRGSRSEREDAVVMVNLSTPVVVEREDRRYVGIHAVVTMTPIASVIPELTREVLSRPQISAAGSEAPIVRYDVIDMERELEIQVGVPVAAEVSGDGLPRFNPHYVV